MVNSFKEHRFFSFSYVVCFVIMSAVVVSFTGCSSSLSYKSIQNKSKCDCKKSAIWYKDICWKDFTESDVTKVSVDSIVSAEMDEYSKVAVDINGAKTPLSSFLLLPEGDQYLVIMMFDYKDELHSLLSVVSEKKLGKKNEEFPLDLYKGNLLEGTIDSVSMASGICSFNMVDKEQFKMTMKAQMNEISNGNGISIETTVSESLMGRGNSEVEVKGNEAFISGELGTVTYAQIKNVIDNHPDVTTLVLGHINGSLNDEVNMHTGRIVHEAGWTTKVLSNSEIASGGVDLFCAGTKRIVEKGAKIGIHSWCCFNDLTAIELPKNHPAHKYQIEYFSLIMGEESGVNFYFHTLEAAPFDGVHWMTDDEIKKWNVSTEFINKIEE